MNSYIEATGARALVVERAMRDYARHVLFTGEIEYENYNLAVKAGNYKHVLTHVNPEVRIEMYVWNPNRENKDNWSKMYTVHIEWTNEQHVIEAVCETMRASLPNRY